VSEKEEREVSTISINLIGKTSFGIRASRGVDASMASLPAARREESPEEGDYGGGTKTKAD
jgi:hypothetical protein